MSGVRWKSLAGGILYCDFLSYDQQKIYEHISSVFFNVNSEEYGVIKLNIDNSLLSSGNILIKNLSVIMPNGMFIEYKNSDYILEIDINNKIKTPQMLLPIYLSLTAEENIRNINIQTNNGFVEMPVSQSKLNLSLNPNVDALLIGNIRINEFGVYEFLDNSCLLATNKVYEMIDNMNLYIYKYLLIIKSNEADINKLPIFNLLYSMALNLKYLTKVREIWMKLNDIYSIIVGFSNQIPTLGKYSILNNIDLCGNLIKNINNIISLQSKFDMKLFNKNDGYYSVSIGNNNGQIEIMLEPGDDDNGNLLWVRNEMRIASQSKMNEVRKLRNIGINRTIVDYDKSMIIIKIDINSEWFIQGEELCIDFPIDITNIILKNIRLRLAKND